MLNESFLPVWFGYSSGKTPIEIIVNEVAI